MSSTNIIVILQLIVLQMMSNFASARNYCGIYRGQTWYCESDRYCCGYDGDSALCCRATLFYGLWYFWVILGVVIAGICSGIGFCCKRRRNQQRIIPNQNAITAVTTTQVATTQQGTPYNQNQGYVGSPAHQPPPYHQPVAAPQYTMQQGHPVNKF